MLMFFSIFTSTSVNGTSQIKYEIADGNFQTPVEAYSYFLALSNQIFLLKYIIWMWFGLFKTNHYNNIGIKYHYYQKRQ